jgi:hypothetical protein
MLLNCDLGESYGSWSMGMDEQVMPFIDQANIACGFHGGDPVTICHTLRLAAKHSVLVGAHPAYPGRFWPTIHELVQGRNCSVRVVSSLGAGRDVRKPGR